MFVREKEKCITTTSLSSTEWWCITFNICMKNGIKMYAKEEKSFITLKICGRAIWKIISEAIYRKSHCGECLLLFMFSLNHLACCSIATYWVSSLGTVLGSEEQKQSKGETFKERRVLWEVLSCRVSSRMGSPSCHLIRKESDPVEHEL